MIKFKRSDFDLSRDLIRMKSGKVSKGSGYTKTISNHLKSLGIKNLYHFTDESNLEVIKENGGLFSLDALKSYKVAPNVFSSDELSRNLDARNNLTHYIRCSWIEGHPMLFISKKRKQIKKPIIFKINLSVVDRGGVLLTDSNAAKTSSLKVGEGIDFVEKLELNKIVECGEYLKSDRSGIYQAEILIPNFLSMRFVDEVIRKY